MQKKVKVAVTGAGGQISYTLLFRLASGEVFGQDCQVDLQLLELPAAAKVAEGVAKEMCDCALPNLGEVNVYDDAKQAFAGVNWAILVGAKPRTKGMERSDLLLQNAAIFVAQGKALAHAASDLRVVVVGNPCNTNALIAAKQCPEVPNNRFTAMTMLDENRAKAQIANRLQTSITAVKDMYIWGNHSPTMYPDFEYAQVNGKALVEQCERAWLEHDFLQKVKQRGAEIISYRGSSSAASAAYACAKHVACLAGTGASTMSAAVITDRSYYGLPADLCFSLPLTINSDGSWEVIGDIPLSDYAKQQLRITTDDLLAEKQVVAEQALLHK
ncbi:MAG: malate dehydrogenase [Pseudomonadota bacterium]|nr:malate dehydrogenase [Pseudomonadota bacterium]